MTLAPPAPAHPVVAGERGGRHSNLLGKIGDHCRRDISLGVGKARMLLIKRELGGEAELAGISLAGQQRQLLGFERPALDQLLRQPQSSHCPATPGPDSRLGELTDREENR